MFRALLVFATAVFIGLNPASAAYDSNTSGQIEGFYVYSDSDHIYFRLKNQPTSHSGCNPAFFVISETVPVDRRKSMLARLSLAYALGEFINIGFSGTGDCAGGYIRVYRVG